MGGGGPRSAGAGARAAGGRLCPDRHGPRRAAGGSRPSDLGELLADLGPLLELLLASIDELLELLLASIDELLELLLAVFASRFDKQKAVSRRAGDRSTGDSASSCSRFDPRAPDFVQQRAAGGELLEDRGPGRAGC